MQIKAPVEQWLQQDEAEGRHPVGVSINWKLWETEEWGNRWGTGWMVRLPFGQSVSRRQSIITQTGSLFCLECVSNLGEQRGHSRSASIFLMTNHLREGNLRPERSRNLPELHTRPASGSLAAKSVFLTTTPYRLSSPGYGTRSGCRHTRFTSRSNLTSFQCDGEVGWLHWEDNRPYLRVTIKIKWDII